MHSPPLIAAPGELAALEPEQPVESLEQFLDWYAKIETTVAQGRESKYSQALAVLRNRQQDIDQLLQYVDAVSENLTDMQHQHRVVEEKTNPIRTMSAQLLRDQAQLQQSVDYLQHDLAYFDDLEPITKLMHAPGEAVCLHANFIPYLRRLVECTEHIQKNPIYKDAELYLLKFQQNLTRGLTLIKLYFVNHLRSLGTEVTKKIADKDKAKGTFIPISSLNTLLYIHFRSLATTLRPLCHELEECAQRFPDYESLRNDCCSTYATVRSQLLGTRTQAELAWLTKENADDFLDTVRLCCTFVMGLCQHEFHLFSKFFTTPAPAIVALQELLCNHLYHHFRPMVARETNPDTLSEICQTLEAYQVSPTAVAHRSSTPDALTATESTTSEDSLQPFYHTITRILKDAQARLVHLGHH
ncbi:Golgi transport complex subunit 3 [Dimargaris xerosporica]|nr:Golgi transport complex subunit 3 [Dimargaris xerosporica]